MQPNYLRHVLPTEMRGAVRSLLDLVDRVRLARTCTLFAEEDAPFLTLPPALAAYASDCAAMSSGQRASMRVLFLDLLSVRQHPVMAWVFSLADGVRVHETETRIAEIDEDTGERTMVHAFVTELRVKEGPMRDTEYMGLRVMYVEASGLAFYGTREFAMYALRSKYLLPFAESIVHFIDIVRESIKQ